jgi:hypothetical protein
VKPVDVNMVMVVNLAVTGDGVTLVVDRIADGGWRANKRQDVNHSTMDMVTRFGVSGLDGGQTKSGAEGIGHLNEFVLDMLATRTTSGYCVIVELRGQSQLGYGAIRKGMAKAEVGDGGYIVGTGYDDHTQRAGGNLTEGSASQDSRKQIE